MKFSHLIRQSHRWVSIVFTMTVIANFVALGAGGGAMPPARITYSPLLPLFLLLFSGLYLFVLPYVARRRGGQGADGAGAPSKRPIGTEPSHPS